ncbi:MAG TPA: Ldh family oxidoreductase [Vicinamibacteria bacterium]|nr:Ldh family oxidoreductase [Vicinamibacteria bacterium]
MRHRAEDLLACASALLRAAGLPADRAAVVAEVLLESDLLGHDTHGLALLPAYLKDLDAGRMATAGDPDVLRDEGGSLTWDGKYLPGPWLIKRAIAAATVELAVHPLAAVAIRRSHHIGCLAAYLKAVTDQGRVILLTCSDPSGAGVAPHGGVASRLTPNPLAAGFPTAGDPVLMDISMSTTTNAMTRRTYEAGERLPGPWLVDAAGHASDDPAVLFGERPGAVLPLGGLDLGHKGFALALLVEALTSGLAGHGRADEPKRWGASVFLMLVDPDRFGGREAFVRETTKLADLCRTAPVAPGAPPVRLPGAAALARRARQLEEGVTLHPAVLPRLAPWAERLGVPMPV